MQDLPSADDIRKIEDPDLLDDQYQAEWLDTMLRMLADFLLKKSDKLKSNQIIIWSYARIGSKPTRYDRLWAKRHQEVISILREKGYFVEAVAFSDPIEIAISLHDFEEFEIPAISFDDEVSFNFTARKHSSSWWNAFLSFFSGH